MSGFLPPENARFPPSRREWAIRGAIVLTALGLVAAAVAWRAAPRGGYEHELRAAVRHDYCVRISTNRTGWGDPNGALNGPARARFAAFCDELGPSVTWLRFPDAAAMREAMAADAADPDPLLAHRTVCVSRSRAELVAFDEVSTSWVRSLCRKRDATIVRPSR